MYLLVRLADEERAKFGLQPTNGLELLAEAAETLPPIPIPPPTEESKPEDEENGESENAKNSGKAHEDNEAVPRLAQPPIIPERVSSPPSPSAPSPRPSPTFALPPAISSAVDDLSAKSPAPQSASPGPVQELTQSRRSTRSRAKDTENISVKTDWKTDACSYIVGVLGEVGGGSLAKAFMRFEEAFKGQVCTVFNFVFSLIAHIRVMYRP